MDITTTYDSLSQQLTVRSGTDTAPKSTASRTTVSSTATGTASGTSLDSASLSPLLQTRAENAALQTQFTKTLAAKFEELGIDTSQAVTLTRSSDGTVTVSGDHPDKAAIEQLFTDVPALTEAFNALAENSTTLASMTTRQSASLVRSNGYAAYLQQLGSTASTGDFFYSYMDGASATYFD
jgi:hypothetical protein